MTQEQRAGVANSGFTLVEVLVSLMLTLLVAAAIATFNRFQLFTLSDQAVRLDVQSTARAVTDLISREVRRAGLNATLSFCGIAQAREDALRIQADRDGSGALDAANEDVTYRYDAGRQAIERVDHVLNRADVLAGDMRTVSLTFKYFDADGNQLTGASDADGTSSGYLGPPARTSVRRIRVTLVLAEDAANPNSSQVFRFRAATDIDLRNRFFAAGVVNVQPCS